jgi:hypothetical protein
MVYHSRMGKEIFAAAALAASVLLPFAAHAGEDESPDAKQAEEREHQQRLRRAQAELDARYAEQLRRLEAVLARQHETLRLQGIDAGAVRRESYLDHEVYWTRRERDSLSRDPADLSSMARRGSLEHQIYQHRNELDRTGPLRQGASATLDSLRWR